MRKICLVHYSSAPGGIEVLMPVIVNRLHSRRFKVFVIRPPDDGCRNVYDRTGLSVNYGSRNNLIAALKLFIFVRRNKDSVIHGFNTGPFFLLTIRLAGGQRVIYSVRGTIHYANKMQMILRKIIWYLAISKKYILTANSEYSRDVFQRFLPVKDIPVEVLYNPVGTSRTRLPEERERSHTLNIAYVGRLSEGKNLFRWLEIAGSIHKRWPEARFFIYGEGPLKDRLTEYARTLAIDGYISFCGYQHDVANAYHEADVLMFLSEYESFGNVVVESILCGTPVIATAIPSLREIFGNFPVFLVPGDASMERNILDRLSRRDELKAAAESALSEFSVRFSEEQHISRLQDIYSGFDNCDLKS